MDEVGMSEYENSLFSLMININVVNLRLFYNMDPEKTFAQHKIDGLEKKKVGLKSIQIKIFNALKF